VLAAIEIQKRCAEKKLQVKNLEGKDCEMGVGIGIHTGSTSVGEVGTAYKDFTVIGNVVNLASRMQGAAQIGETLVTDDVYRHVSDLFPDSQMRDYNVKGIDLPVQAYPIAKSLVLDS
jgi:adenylate cyclase